MENEFATLSENGWEFTDGKRVELKTLELYHDLADVSDIDDAIEYATNICRNSATPNKSMLAVLKILKDHRAIVGDINSYCRRKLFDSDDIIIHPVEWKEIFTYRRKKHE